MEQVIREYGQFLLSGIVAIFIISLLFIELKDANGNVGAFEIFGETVEIIDVNHNCYTDFRENYFQESKKSFPVIVYISEHLKIGNIKLE